MPSEEKLSQFNEALEAIIKFKDKDLISRNEWGKLNFKEIEDDINIAIQLADDFNSFSNKYLTTTFIDNIINTCNELSTQLDYIDNFDISIHGSSHSSYVQNVQVYVHQFVQDFHSWYVFVRLRNQNVQEELSQIKTLHNDANQIVVELNTQLEDTIEKSDKTLEELKSAAAKAGVGQHTQQFHEEYKKLRCRTWGWFVGTCCLALTTVIVSFILFWQSTDAIQNQDSLELSIISIIAAKLSTVGILVAATLWVGRIYKSLVHLTTVYKHRSVSLQTFQTFVSAAGDARTRDYVLRAATNCIFSNVPTGFVEAKGKGTESTVQFTEINPFSQYSKDDNDS